MSTSASSCSTLRRLLFNGVVRFVGNGPMLLLTAAILTVGKASATDNPPPVSEMLLPGGVAGLLRAADVSTAPDPSTAMLAFVRVAHVQSAKPPEQAIRYLDLIQRAQAAAAALPSQELSLPRTGASPAQIEAWATACGLVLAGGVVKDAAGPEAAIRRRVLEQAGVSLDGWVAELNAGHTVRVEIRSDIVPLPLSSDAWMSAVLGRRVARDQLARAVFGERRAAFMYYGLMGLDDDTLAYLASHTPLVSGIVNRGAGVFAEWGRSIQVKNGRVQLPGGESALPLWQAIVGHAPADADGFILALLTRDGGRAAFFYDAVAHLDQARQAFALGPASGKERVERFRALYASFARTKTFDPGEWPVIRHPVSPAAVLRQLQAGPSGTMAAPARRGFWEAVLGVNAQGCAHASDDAQAADAAWIVERIEREPLDMRGDWVGAIAFAQRVFSTANVANLPAACEVVASFPRSDGLLLTLERIGLDDPKDYSKVLTFAGRLWAGLDRRAAVVRTAQVQGVLAILERAVSSGVVAKPAGRALVMSLAALPPGASSSAAPGPAAASSAEAGLAPGVVGRWIRDTLLTDLCKDPASGDGCLVRAVSGDGAPGGAGLVVFWEDERYRVDLGAATVVRIDRVRQAQKATRVDEALNLISAATAMADPRSDDATRPGAETILRATIPALNLGFSELFGHAVPEMRPILEAAVARLSTSPTAAKRAELAASVTEVSDVLLADALVSFAYALAIGDPDDAILLGGNPARHHLFDAVIGPAADAWHLPQEVQLLDKSWVIEGSVMLLRTVYPRSWVRRLSIQDPGTRPRPDPQDVRAFGETAASLNPFQLTDASRDAVVAAIRRGRSRMTELVGTPDLLWKKAREIGLGEWRCRAALWSAGPDPQRAARLFSLAELMWIGDPDVPQAALDAWGVATRPIDGSAQVRMPRGVTWEDVQGPRGVGLLPTQVADVHLRIAEALSDLKLPASLAPDIAAYAVWDVMTSADMAYPDDWFALVRAVQSLPRERLLDYVSALTAIGPLVPAR